MAASTVVLGLVLGAAGCMRSADPAGTESAESRPPTSERAAPEAGQPPSYAAAETAADSPTAPATDRASEQAAELAAEIPVAEIPAVPTPWRQTQPILPAGPGRPSAGLVVVPLAQDPAPAAPAPSPADAPAPEPPRCTTPPFAAAPPPEYGSGIPAMRLDVVPAWDLQTPAGLEAAAAVEWWAGNGPTHVAAAAQRALADAAAAPDEVSRDAVLVGFLADGLVKTKTLQDRIAAYQTIALGVPAVAQAAQAPLDSGDPAVVAEFLRRGQYAAAVEGAAETSRGAVLRAAEGALADGTREALMEFLRTGMLEAQAANDRQSVYALLAAATPAVWAAAQDALAAHDPLVVVEFLRAGQYAAAAKDACA
ncbi:hypothetical protein [Sinomonas sp. R1AF57]|uniref:hypothetical protein n=1 Tax=Sinomonas sp. R1AF57 TaxID=2020377 RepID=UPI001ABFEC4A|nr:hypothetical protein [Sinomonas sp. R1AF57]